MEKVGEECVVTMKKEQTMADGIETPEGMRFDYGYVRSYFITNVRPQWVEFKNRFILLSEKKISLPRNRRSGLSPTHHH